MRPTGDEPKRSSSTTRYFPDHGTIPLNHIHPASNSKQHDLCLVLRKLSSSLFAHDITAEPFVTDLASFAAFSLGRGWAGTRALDWLDTPARGNAVVVRAGKSRVAVAKHLGHAALRAAAQHGVSSRGFA